MSILKKQNVENNMEIHEINKEIMKMNGCFCEISNFLNNYLIKENVENNKNGNE
ncbi:MAG: hypothetical protein LUH05_04205 [Candidatus Gastranaerophilales bacterium]|nr:hypothetical protein [Candidatus Gastranaerophilales bacterium]